MLDIAPVVEQLRQQFPEHFETLLRVPSTQIRIHYDRYVILGGSGGMPPQEIFVFRLSKIESGAFSGTTLTDKLYCGMGVLEASVYDHVTL